MLYDQSNNDGLFGGRRPDKLVQEPCEDISPGEERPLATKAQYIGAKRPETADDPSLRFSEARPRINRAFSDEPLLGLFKDTNVGERRDDQPQGSYQSAHVDLPVVDVSTQRSLRVLRGQILNSRELITLLRAGQSNLNIWSGAFPDELGTVGNVSLERLRDHIYGCLHSDNMTNTVKAALCLALYIQQLPTGLDTTEINLLAPLNNLEESYLAAAESLLAADDGPAGTLGGLECMILLSDFYINRGCLRKVWLILRRAVSLAQLLGLQRRTDADIHSERSLRRTAIWSQLWQRDRGVSLILGMPYATLDSQIFPLSSRNDDSNLQSHERFLRDLGIVMGHIIDRDQNTNGTTYSTTLKIEEELEQCQSIMPAAWWDFTPRPDTPTDLLANTFVAKMRYYTVRRLLHLPFLLHALENEKYKSSRLAVLQSSRAMISIYNVLRDEERPILKICEMVDFQVFASAMTLLVSLLACRQLSDHRDLHREERDWQLVFQTAGELRRFSRSTKGCKVAALGAQVLEDFSGLQKASAEEICKVDIPYFGRVKIQRHRFCHDEQNPGADTASQTMNQTQVQQNSRGGIEGSIEPVVSTDSYLFPISTASQLRQEAGESWLHMLDTSLVDDWNLLDSSMADDWNWFPRGSID